MRWHQRIVSAFGNVLSFGPGSAIGPLMLAWCKPMKPANSRDRYLASAQLYQVLMTVFSTLNKTRLTTSPRVVRAISLIEERGGDGVFNVKQMAEELDCSREHLAAGSFRGSIGRGPAGLSPPNIACDWQRGSCGAAMTNWSRSRGDLDSVVRTISAGRFAST